MIRTVSTWSLHRTLGRFAGPDSATLGGPFLQAPVSPGGLALLDLPAELKAHGYGAVQIVHFHLPSRDPAYLAQLRDALAAADIELDTLLIDDGDLTDEANAERVDAWLDGWLETASALGATRARLIVGRSEPTPERVRTTAERLVRMAGAHPGVRVVIENWLGMFPDARAVETMLAATGDSVGLLIDLGNWRGPDKYDQLARIAARAETCHAKCHTTGDDLDTVDFRRSLQVLKDAGYAGPLALIYDGDNDDEWAMLDAEWEIVTSVFADDASRAGVVSGGSRA